MIKILSKNNNLYNLELDCNEMGTGMGMGMDTKDFNENELMEIFSLGIYIKRNILKNSIIKVSDDSGGNYLNKENEQLNKLLESKNREILEMNNAITERIKLHSVYLERELNDLRVMNKHKDNMINNMNDKILNIREQIKSEFNVDELIKINRELLNEKSNNSINKIGRVGESKLYEYLMNTETLKNYYKFETNKMSHCGDFCIYDEVNNYGVIVENKNYQYLVPREEVNKFRSDCFRNMLFKPNSDKSIKMNIIGGLFLSYKSGVSEKKSPLDMCIDNNKILIYVSEYNKYPNLIEDSILYIFNLFNTIKDILDTNSFKCIKDKMKEILNKYTYLYNQLINDISNMRKLVDNFEINLRNLNNNIIEEIKILVMDNSKKEEVNNLELYIFNEVHKYLSKKNTNIINVKALIEEKVFKENVKTAQGISQILGKYKEFEIDNIKIIYNNLGTRRMINSKECKNYFIIE